jgi:hypothetical protein
VLGTAILAGYNQGRVKDEVDVDEDTDREKFIYLDNGTEM